MKKQVDNYVSMVEKLGENQSLILPLACLFLGIIIGFWLSPAKNGISIWCDNTVGSNNGNSNNKNSRLKTSRSNYKNNHERRVQSDNSRHEN